MLIARPAASMSLAGSRVIGLFAPIFTGALAFLDVRVALAVPCAAAAALGVPLVLARVQGKRALPPHALGALGIALSFVVLAVASLPSAPGAPLWALAFALAVVAGGVVAGRRLALALPLGAVALALSLVARGAEAADVVALALLYLGFGALGRGLFFATLTAVRARQEARVDAELLRLYDDARLFGLVGSAEPGDGASADKRLVAQTLAVRDGCYRLLRLGARALRPDAAALYLLDSAGKQLLLKEQLVHVDGALAVRLAVHTGAPGLALKRRQAVRLVDTAGAGAAVQAHRNGARAVLCTPLRDPFAAAGALRGVLVFDRSSSLAFTDEDESFALALAQEIEALLRTERVLERLDGEHQKIARIFGAARAFSGVVRLDDAMDQALAAALDLAPRASAALLLLEPGRSLRVRRVGGASAALLACDEPLSLDDDTWVARAIAQRTALPHTALHARANSTGRRSAIDAPEGGRGLYHAADRRALQHGDLRVAPLFAQGEVVAALVVVTPPGERLKPAVVDGLLVAADLAGVAIGGARLFETVQQQATTDGLTGLVNRRTLDTRLDEAIARARRLRTPLCVLLGDIDHFKSVNDTYGHGTGDEVLKHVAHALTGVARTSDVVARYGGEEFCVVLEGTEQAGGVRLAERMRLAIKELRFATANGPLSVTASFGVALLLDSDDAHTVRARADAALYRAKERGRDRVLD